MVRAHEGQALVALAVVVSVWTGGVGGAVAGAPGDGPLGARGLRRIFPGGHRGDHGRRRQHQRVADA
jgi:hypothetical protein